MIKTFQVLNYSLSAMGLSFMMYFRLDIDCVDRGGESRHSSDGCLRILPEQGCDSSFADDRSLLPLHRMATFEPFHFASHRRRGRRLIQSLRIALAGGRLPSFSSPNRFNFVQLKIHSGPGSSRFRSSPDPCKQLPLFNIYCHDTTCVSFYLKYFTNSNKLACVCS